MVSDGPTRFHLKGDGNILHDAVAADRVYHFSRYSRNAIHVRDNVSFEKAAPPCLVRWTHQHNSSSPHLLPRFRRVVFAHLFPPQTEASDSIGPYPARGRPAERTPLVDAEGPRDATPTEEVIARHCHRVPSPPVADGAHHHPLSLPPFFFKRTRD